MSSWSKAPAPTCLTYKVEEFIKGGSLFRNLARMSAAGPAGDHGDARLLHRRRRLPDGPFGLHRDGAGPLARLSRRAPLLKAATGEIATEEELGGALMHTSISGLGDYLAEDDRDAIRIAREILAHIDWNRDLPAAPPRRFKPPRHDAEELLGIMPMDPKRPVDMRQVIARIADDSDFLPFGEDYGSATVVGHIKIEGLPLGVVTNNGPIDSAGANKATHFIQACCQARTPILYLNNTTGYMVGKAHEEAGMIKHGSKMIQAVTNATVPQITLYCGASYGAGNYGMCGRGFHPRFCFSWPNARTAVMGAEQAAGTMVMVTEAAMKRKGAVDQAKLDELERRIIERFESQTSVFTTSARLLDDGVIDPRDTRAVIAQVLSICRDAELRRPQPMQFSVARP
jgi:geranyl-CoA carboxylase beta subunit